MIGLDTNVLLRLIVAEDVVHSPRARALLSRLEADGPGYINTVVLAEFAWTLRSSYRYERGEILAVVEDLARNASIVLADRDAVSLALDLCRERPVDFADALIAAINRSAGCTATFSFDESAVAQALFEPVP